MTTEPQLTAYIADILQKARIKAIPEQPFPYYRKGKRYKRIADLVCYEVKGYTIGIEAKKGWGIKLNANKTNSLLQAEELIFNKAKNQFSDDCHAALAIIYPESWQTREHAQNGRVMVAVRTPIDIRKKKAPEWNKRKVKDLPGLIKRIPTQLGQWKDLAKQAEDAVNEAFKKLSQKADVDNLKETIGEKAEGTTVKGLLADLLTCFMFHTKLDEIRHQSFRRKADRPPTLRECIDSDNIIRSFIDAYAKWITIDYTEILEWNSVILSAMPYGARSNDAVRQLARAAESIQSAKGSHHHDVVGITFCNAIEAAKQEGAMYTTLPAATLLVHLLFYGAKINWKSLEEITRLRIVDFACGSGTLLIAAANYILQKEKTGNKKAVAKALVEQMLYGFDINNRAIFQTVTGLGMISPSVAFENTQLHSMMLGVPKGETEARLGSLEMLRGMDDLVFNAPIVGKKSNSPEKEIKCDKFHFAIMNPPFTIMEKRYKQKKPELEKKLREREKYFRQINPAMTAAGHSTAFVPLVDKYIDHRTGKAGIILPAMIPSGATSKKARLWIAERFHIQYIIVSYDPERIFFSGNTSIGEMLLVLERKKKSPTPTKVIKLFDNPATEADGYLCAQEILDGEGEKWGEVDEISPEDIAKGDWSATQFLSNELYRIARDIPNHWKSTLGKQIRILHRTQIIIGGQKCDRRAMHATPALYSHKTTHCDKMEVKPDCWVKPKKTHPELAKILQNPSRLKIAWRIRFTTIKNFACRTTVPSVSASWATIEVADIPNADKETIEKAVCVILNSTPAKVSTILERTNKIPAYSHLGNVKLNRVAMPLLNEMSVSAFRGLAKVYDEWCKQPRKRLPEAYNCPVQKAIDKAVCKHTGFHEELCVKARHLIAQEPMVTGQRYQANPEETNPQLFD